VFRLVCTFMWLCVAAGIFCRSEVSVGYAAQTAQTAQAPDEAKKTENGPVENSEAAQSAPPTAAKPATKPKQIITNDDIKSSPDSGFGGVFYVSAGAINNCDSMCFDQLRWTASPGGKENPNWRRDVLQQLDFVRSDSAWQGYLHELYRAHDAICQLTLDKQDELRRSGSTRNLGPHEIAIADKYDDKISAAQATLTSAVARESELRKRFADKPIASSFAMTQGVRMQGGFCSQSKVIFLP
jgi:hypothetical protein